MRQRGFTLIEVLAVMFISGMLIMSLTTSVFQVTALTGRNTSKGLGLRDLHIAAMRIRADLQSVQNTGITTGNYLDLDSATLTLSWTDFNGEPLFEGETRNHISAYSLSGDGTLLRTYDTVPVIVARHITNVRFTQQSDTVVHVRITVLGPGTQQRSETVEFDVNMRSEVYIP